MTAVCSVRQRPSHSHVNVLNYLSLSKVTRAIYRTRGFLVTKVQAQVVELMVVPVHPAMLVLIPEKAWMLTSILTPSVRNLHVSCVTVRAGRTTVVDRQRVASFSELRWARS